jgi:hypothetical protein
MKFMLTIYNNAETIAAIEGPDRKEFRKVHDDIQKELTAEGTLVDSNELSVADATVVRTTDRTMTRTDRPFTEGQDFVGGYYVIECDHRERAVELASRFVEARYAPVEVRALLHP